MAITRIVYPTEISSLEMFGNEFCYALHPDMLELSGRVEMYRIPLWEVPMDAPGEPIINNFLTIMVGYVPVDFVDSSLRSEVV